MELEESELEYLHIFGGETNRKIKEDYLNSIFSHFDGFVLVVYSDSCPVFWIECVGNKPIKDRAFANTSITKHEYLESLDFLRLDDVELAWSNCKGKGKLK